MRNNTIFRQHGRYLLFAPCLLAFVLNASTAQAQKPPGKAAGPGADHARNIRRVVRQRQTHSPARSRANESAKSRDPAQRLAQLEAKIDTLLREVRELRRQVNRLSPPARAGANAKQTGPPSGRDFMHRFGPGMPHPPYHRYAFPMRPHFMPPFGGPPRRGPAFNRPPGPPNRSHRDGPGGPRDMKGPGRDGPGGPRRGPRDMKGPGRDGPDGPRRGPSDMKGPRRDGPDGRRRGPSDMKSPRRDGPDGPRRGPRDMKGPGRDGPDGPDGPRRNDGPQKERPRDGEKR